MYTNSDDMREKVINAGRVVGMKTCGHSEEGEMLKGYQQGPYMI